MFRDKLYVLAYTIIISMISSGSCFASVKINSKPIDLIIRNEEYLLVPVEVNNTIGWFVIDTGADGSSITSDFVKKARLRNINNINLYLNGSDNPIETIEGSADIKLGESLFKNSLVTALDVLAFNFEHDGVLGYDILSKVKFILDYENRKLILYERIGDKEHAAAMGKSKSAFIKMEIGECSFTVLLDTGADKTIFSRDEWDNVVRCGEASRLVEVGEAVHNATFGQQKFVQLSYSSARAPVSIGAPGAKKYEIYVHKGNDINLLGLDFIKKFRIKHIGNHNFIFE